MRNRVRNLVEILEHIAALPMEQADPAQFGLFRSLREMFDNNSIPVLRSAVEVHAPELADRFEVALAQSKCQLLKMEGFLAYIFRND